MATTERAQLSDLSTEDIITLMILAKSFDQQGDKGERRQGNHVSEDTLSMRQEDVAKSLGVASGTLSDRMKKIEEVLGTYLRVRSDQDPNGGRKPSRSSYPEDTKALHGDRNLSSKATNELTLDGRIWGTFAELVVTLFEMTEAATRRSPCPPQRLPPLFRPFDQMAGPLLTAPDRHLEQGRENYRQWLLHMRNTAKSASEFAHGDEGSLFDLDQLLPVRKQAKLRDDGRR
jgi:hypothetical protein